MHDEHDQGHHAAGPPARRRPRSVRRLALTLRPERASSSAPYLDGERTPNRPDATGLLRGSRTDVTPDQLARAAVEGVVCNLLAAADALGSEDNVGKGVPRRRGRPQPGLPARGRRPHRRAVVVPADDEPVAAGAAVQAAALHHGYDFALVAEAWGLGRGDTVEPDDTVDRAAIRGGRPRGGGSKPVVRVPRSMSAGTRPAAPSWLTWPSRPASRS